MRTTMTVQIERARSINTGNGVWNTMMAEGTLDEKIIDFFDSFPGCHNVTSITNFTAQGNNVVTCDVEYNKTLT